MPAPALAAESVVPPVTGGVRVDVSPPAVAGDICGAATASPLVDVCPSLFAEAAAALSAARLSLASSIVHAAASRANASAALLDATPTRGCIGDVLLAEGLTPRFILTSRIISPSMSVIMTVIKARDVQPPEVARDTLARPEADSS
jgi:hypothetical protein